MSNGVMELSCINVNAHPHWPQNSSDISQSDRLSKVNIKGRWRQISYTLLLNRIVVTSGLRWEAVQCLFDWSVELIRFSVDCRSVQMIVESFLCASCLSLSCLSLRVFYSCPIFFILCCTNVWWNNHCSYWFSLWFVKFYIKIKPNNNVCGKVLGS